MKRKSFKKLKIVMPFVIVFSIVFSASLPMIASAFGADTNDLDVECVYIRNVASGKYMTVPDGTISNGKEIKIYEYTGDVRQEWYVYKVDGDYYCIHSSANDNYVLYVESANDSNGQRIVLKYVASGAAVPEGAQFMMFGIDTWQSAYLLSRLSVDNGTVRAIDCENDGSTDGTKLVQYNVGNELEENASQLWVFESVERSTVLNSWDLVDTGKHCDWDSSSQYTSMVRKAADAWNNYIGAEVFRDDAWNIVQDVKIKDLDSDPTGEGAIARTYSSGVLSNGIYASSIYFYTDQMNNLQSDLQRQKVVMHELGHALGLGHNRATDSSNKLGNIMQQGELPYSTYISLDDKASVEESYARF